MGSGLAPFYDRHPGPRASSGARAEPPGGLPQGRDGLAEFDEPSVPPAGRKRIADSATVPGPGETWLDYGEGHNALGLSKNPVAFRQRTV